MAQLESKFTIRDNEIFMHLHEAAYEQAKKKAEKEKDIINTAVSKDEKFFGGNSDNIYEFGVIYEVKDYKDTNKEGMFGDDAQQQAEKNKDAEDSLKKNAYSVIYEYFKWFSGEDIAKQIKETDLKKFYPNQRIAASVKNFKIEELDYDEFSEEMKKKPIIGFKIQYKMDYESSGEK